jgi:propanediol dehydratase large subunit
MNPPPQGFRRASRLPVSGSLTAGCSQVTLAGDANAIVNACSLLVKSHAARPVVLADFDERGYKTAYPGVVCTYGLTTIASTISVYSHRHLCLTDL